MQRRTIRHVRGFVAIPNETYPIILVIIQIANNDIQSFFLNGWLVSIVASNIVKVEKRSSRSRLNNVCMKDSRRVHSLKTSK